MSSIRSRVRALSCSTETSFVSTFTSTAVTPSILPSAFLIAVAQPPQTMSGAITFVLSDDLVSIFSTSVVLHFRFFQIPFLDRVLDVRPFDQPANVAERFPDLFPLFQCLGQFVAILDHLFDPFAQVRQAG